MVKEIDGGEVDVKQMLAVLNLLTAGRDDLQDLEACVEVEGGFICLPISEVKLRVSNKGVIVQFIAEKE